MGVKVKSKTVSSEQVTHFIEFGDVDNGYKQGLKLPHLILYVFGCVIVIKG